MVGFDEYDRKARLTPGLLAVAPIALLILALGWREYPVVAGLAAVLVASGATYVLALLVRQMGRRIEPQLWESWGGPPTTRLLRTRSPASNVPLRDARREAVHASTGVQLLSPVEEIADPALADSTIDAAVRQLTHLGQSGDHKVLRLENIQYGFERNLFGIRWAGRAIATLSFATTTALLVLNVAGVAAQELSLGALVAGVVIEAMFALGWWTLPSASRTRSAAERYANSLLQAVVVDARCPGGSS